MNEDKLTEKLVSVSHDIYEVNERMEWLRSSNKNYGELAEYWELNGRRIELLKWQSWIEGVLGIE